MVNVFKIVFLGIVAFGIIIFFTAEEPQKVVLDDNVVNIVRYDYLPTKYELVGKDGEVTRDSLFKKGQKTLLVVGNHDSLAVVKELPKYFKIDIPYVMVANISSAPWFVKKMFIPKKLEELNTETNIPMIYDFDGLMVEALNVVDNSKTKYFVYIINKDGVISKIYDGIVKEGALDGTMNEEEKKAALAPLVELIK